MCSFLCDAISNFSIYVCVFALSHKLPLVDEIEWLKSYHHRLLWELELAISQSKKKQIIDVSRNHGLLWAWHMTTCVIWGYYHLLWGWHMTNCVIWCYYHHNMWNEVSFWVFNLEGMWWNHEINSDDLQVTTAPT